MVYDLDKKTQLVVEYIIVVSWYEEYEVVL